MDLYLTTPVGPFADALGVAVNTFTTNQDAGSPIPCPIIAPNQLRIGSRIKIEAEGEFSTTATPTLALGFYVGLPGTGGKPAALTTILAASTAITTATATAFPWRMEYRGFITTVGTAGQIIGQGDLELGTSLVAFSANAIPATLALRTVALDTTLARCVGVCAAYSASSASNAVRVYNLTVQLHN